MRVPGLSLCVIIGCLPLIWLPQLPSLPLIALIGVLAAALAFRDRLCCRYAGLCLLLLCWALLAGQQTLWPIAALSGNSHQLSVRLTATDGQTRHRADIERIDGRRVFPAPAIALEGSTLPQAACVGQRWDLSVRARPVHGQLNDGGFDGQRYAVSRHQVMTGRILAAQIVDPRCSLRARFVAGVDQALAAYPWRSIMLALALGERTALAPEVRMLMQQTGTLHLIAISGLHISLAAWLGWLLCRGLQRVLPVRLIDWRMPLVGGLFCALLYAWLSGLQPPAQRTLIAAVVWGGLRLRGRQWSAWDVWLCCIAAILLYDPLAVLSQSLWLSAFAVAALIFWYQWVPLPGLSGPRLWQGGLRLLHLQLGLLLLLMPLQVALFHGVSVSSLVANLLAVPLVTLGVVPLLLGGLVLHLCGPQLAEQGAWWLADRLLAGLVWLLRQLPPGWLDVDERWQWLTLLPWMLIVCWRLHLWRRVPVVIVTVATLLSVPLWRGEPVNRWSVTMLDVGQGLALVIARHGRAVLYDTGPGWPGGDSAQQVIVPWLRWHHLRPEGIILSHEHLDHRGGLETLRQQWPGLWVRSPLGWAGHEPCERGVAWQWQGLHFRTLWPLPGATASGNNRSCVVRVDDGKTSLLLTGDIEIPAEMAMLSHYWQQLPSTLIQVPHHGSNTSSSLALIQRVNGAVALASASRYNAWHLPSPRVSRRYRERGYQWLDTPHQGQITVHIDGKGWQIQRLRDQIFRRWYHQWFGDVRENG